MSLENLVTTIKSAVDKRIKEESRAMRGTIRNGRFYCGNKSYAYVQAVDCNTSEGNKVWAQRSQNGSAVIIGE